MWSPLEASSFPVSSRRFGSIWVTTLKAFGANIFPPGMPMADTRWHSGRCASLEVKSDDCRAFRRTRVRVLFDDRCDACLNERSVKHKKKIVILPIHNRRVCS